MMTPKELYLWAKSRGVENSPILVRGLLLPDDEVSDEKGELINDELEYCSCMERCECEWFVTLH